MASLRVDRVRNTPGAMDYFPMNIHARVHSHDEDPWGHMFVHENSHYDKEYVARIQGNIDNHIDSHAHAMHKKEVHNELNEFHIQQKIHKAHYYWGAWAEELDKEIPGFSKMSHAEQNITRLKQAFKLLTQDIENISIQKAFYELTELFLRGDTMSTLEEGFASTEGLLLSYLRQNFPKSREEIDLLLVSLEVIGRLKEKLKEKPIQQ